MKEVPQTFDGISKKFLKMISQFKSPRIDIAFDQYFTPSIKDCERLRRNETTSRVSIGPNQIRHHNFASELKNTQFKEALKCRSFDSSSLPPCKAELYQHLLRVRYVTKFWRNAYLKNPSSLTPLASGWIVNDDKYDFVWYAGEQFPSSAAGIVIKTQLFSVVIRRSATNEQLIHRDLAARNVLLDEDKVVKICDFGLAKDCYKYENYVKKGDGPLPIKWMAIESIRDHVFTTKSDVWSFGILMWEFFTLGRNPYPGIEIDEEFYKKLSAGYRMERPDYCPEDVYHIMQDCWLANPDDRPRFNEISDTLGGLLNTGVKQVRILLS
ncbi:vascular endothelial growth factor receptor 1 [Trichonephila clavipes]|nr:vascular endothelial growth factor receptor 1 [Trichonephila clavipes]